MANRLLEVDREDKRGARAFQTRLSREKPFQAFLSTIDSPETAEFYVFSLKRYMEHTGAKSTYDLLKGESKLIESQMIEYIVENKPKISPGTLRSYLAGVKHFYTLNDVGLNWKKINKYIGKGAKKHQDRAYTNKEILLLLQTADHRGKALILLLASTGCRVGAIPSLKRKHIREVEFNGMKLYDIIFYPGDKEEYKTFCTPECRKAIDSYLEYRERCGEPFNSEAPLIRE